MTFPLPSRLLFIRHGETEWNLAGRLQGQKDIPLNPRGVDQAAASGRAVRKLVGDDRALADYDFIASPLLRTRQTMELARRAMGLPADGYETDDRLKELSFGSWEGLTWREVSARVPAMARARETDKWGYVPPEGESYATLAERVKPWLRRISGDAVVVSHGGVARVLMHMLAGVPPEEAAMADIWQGRLLVFEDGRCRWV